MMSNKKSVYAVAELPQVKWAVTFAFLSLFVLGLADNIRGPLFPEILSGFGLSSSKGALSFATTSTAALIASMLSAYYLKKWTISSLHILSMLIMSIGLLVMGTVPTFQLFLIGSFILGLSIGFMGVSQNLLVSENVSGEARSKALSGLHAMYGFASFLAPLLASSTTLNYQTWRAAFVIVSVICAVFFLIQLLVHPQPGFHVQKHEIGTQTTNLQKISKISLLMMGGLFGFYVVAEILVSTRLAQYMRTYFEMDLEKSSQYVTLFFLFLLIGRVIFALKKIPLTLKLQMNLSLIGSVVLLLIGLKFHPFFLALVGLTMAPFYPLSVAYISHQTGDRSRAFITFAMSFQSLAVISMHLGVGYLTDTLGLFYAFGVGVVALAVSLVCLNFHPKVFKE